MTTVNSDEDYFAHNARAEQRRTEKAKAICRVIWPRDTDRDDRPDLDLVRRYSRDTQKTWEKAAGVRTSHPEELWEQVLVLLDKMHAYETRQQVTIDQLTAALAAPVVRPEPAPVREQVPPPLGRPIDVCLLDCLCRLQSRFTPGGRACPQHPFRWINPIPDPDRTYKALRARAGLSTEAPDMHKIRERHVRQGKSSPGWRREAAR